MTSTSKSIPVDVTMRARYKGKLFKIKLRAVKRSAGLIKSPHVLETGDKLILLVSGHHGQHDNLQLFATVAKQYTKDNAYAVKWDKLVSPTGTVSLLEFIRQTLRVSISPDSAMAGEFAEGEMVYFDFRARELHLPNQGKVIGQGVRLDETPLPGKNGDFDLSTDAIDLETGPIDKPVAVVPDLALNEKTPPAPRVEASRAAQPFIKESEDSVELLGMKLSRDDWDRLETLQYTSSSGNKGTPAGNQNSVKHSPVSPRKPGQSAPAGPQRGSESDKPEVTGLSGFLKKIARKMSQD
jgi:hypothetical protein